MGTPGKTTRQFISLIVLLALVWVLTAAPRHQHDESAATNCIICIAHNSSVVTPCPPPELKPDQLTYCPLPERSLGPLQSPSRSIEVTRGPPSAA